MDMSELAAKMLQWETQRDDLDRLEDEIKTAVLEHGETVTVGNVRATYSKPRKSYDYETGAVEHPHYTKELNEHYKKVSVSIDWRSMCSELGADAPFSTSGNPSVTLKNK